MGPVVSTAGPGRRQRDTFARAGRVAAQLSLRVKDNDLEVRRHMIYQLSGPVALSMATLAILAATLTGCQAASPGDAPRVAVTTTAATESTAPPAEAERTAAVAAATPVRNSIRRAETSTRNVRHGRAGSEANADRSASDDRRDPDSPFGCTGIDATRRL